MQETRKPLDRKTTCGPTGAYGYFIEPPSVLINHHPLLVSNVLVLTV